MASQRVILLYIGVFCFVTFMIFVVFSTRLGRTDNSSTYNFIHDLGPLDHASFKIHDLTLTNESVLLYGSIRHGGNLNKNGVLKIPESIVREMLKISKAPEKHFSYKESVEESVDCAGLMRGDENALNYSKELMEELVSPPLRLDIVLKKCLNFKLNFGFITEPLCREEENFPLAYSILASKDDIQLLQLLKAIYRPQNIYCIHFEVNTTHDVIRSMMSLAKCFDNVFITATYIPMEPVSSFYQELACLRDLTKEKWKYHINLDSFDFPLKTNLQLVRILKAYNGSSDVPIWTNSVFNHTTNSFQATPGNITLVQGPGFGMLSREFVDFIYHSRTARAFRQWLTETKYTPREIYIPTLAVLFQADLLSSDSNTTIFNYSLARYTGKNNSNSEPMCTGNMLDNECVFGLEELPFLISRPEAFARRFNWRLQEFTFGCVEEWHSNTTRDEYLGDDCADN